VFDIKIITTTINHYTVIIGSLKKSNFQSLTNPTVKIFGVHESLYITNKLFNLMNHSISIPAPIFDDVHLIRCPHVQKRSVDPHDETHRDILSHPHVEWAEQQKVLSRKKRQLWRTPQQQQQQMFQQPQMHQQQQQQQQPVVPHDSFFVDLVHLNDNRLVSLFQRHLNEF